MQKLIVAALGDGGAINLGGDFTRRGQNLNTFVWILRVTVYLLVFLEPRVCG